MKSQYHSLISSLSSHPTLLINFFNRSDVFLSNLINVSDSKIRRRDDNVVGRDRFFVRIYLLISSPSIKSHQFKVTRFFFFSRDTKSCFYFN